MPDDPTPASDLWSSAKRLNDYDIVLLPCEGQPISKPAPYLQNMIDYTSAGGRVFTTHYGYVWIEGAPEAFSSTADWTPNAAGYVPDPLPVNVNTSFPKGQAMSLWLGEQGLLTSQGQLPLEESRKDAVRTNGASLPWLTTSSPASLQEYSFDTPTTAEPAAQCGRVSYSDFHVSINGILSTANTTFPDECLQGSATLSPQEQVIEFMLFDLASCIQLETEPTPVPR
jgi:hypothetical protein